MEEEKMLLTGESVLLAVLVVLLASGVVVDLVSAAKRNQALAKRS